MSPILVRPVREQLEHDRVIRLLQVKLKRKHEVIANIDEDQSTSVKIGQLPVPGRVHHLLVLRAIQSAKAINASGGKLGPGASELPEAVHAAAVFWGAFLIALGVLLILANFEVIAYGTLADFWPVAVIVVGLKLVFDSVARPNKDK